jgi:hypothetical protein
MKAARPGSQPKADGIARLVTGDSAMLWTIFVVLLILWLLGFVGFHVLGAYIHVLLVIAVVVLLIQLISGRRPV